MSLINCHHHDNSSRPGRVCPDTADRIRHADTAPWKVIIRMGALGDFILTIPLIRRLCAFGPVCLVTRGRYRGILPADLCCASFVDCDSAEAVALFSAAAAAGRTALFPAGSSAFVFSRKDSGMQSSLEANGIAKVYWIEPRPASPPHAAVQYLAQAGIGGDDFDVTEPVWAEPCAGGDLWIHPGSGGRSKNLEPAVFARLAAEWRQRHGRNVHVSFGEADLELTEPVSVAFEKYSVPFRSLVCPTLAVLKQELQAYASEYIGNDSGVSHLAGALGIPTRVFFKTTDPDIWRPLGQCTVLRAP